MHEDLLPVIEALERSLECNDVQTAVDSLHLLSQQTIYSGNEVYERLRAIEGDIAIMLLQTLEPESFGKAIGGCKNLHQFEIWMKLEEHEQRVSPGALWRIHPYLGFPSPNQCPKLYSKLASNTDNEITQQLINSINRLSDQELEGGSNLTAHQKTTSMFRFLRWLPEDQGLSECVRLLVARTDQKALAAIEGYAKTLPWGVDRRATAELINGLAEAQSRSVLNQVLDEHSDQPTIRRWVWLAIAELDPHDAVMGMLSDLQTASSEERISYVAELGGILENLADSTTDWKNLVSNRIAVLKTKSWSRTQRGYFARVLKRFGHGESTQFARPFDRFLISMIVVWERIRFDHMGCLIPILIFFGGVWGIEYGLDIVLGEATRTFQIMDRLMFGFWFLFSLFTMRTHFSGHESLNEKTVTAMIYFGLLITWLVVAVAGRLI